MAISYEIDAGARIVRATVRGDLSLEEDLQFLRSALADERWEPGFGILYDNRERGSVTTADYVKAAASFVEESRDSLGPAKVAVVVSRVVSVGLANMFAILTEHMPVTTKVFWDIEEAERWLSEG